MLLSTDPLVMNIIGQRMKDRGLQISIVFTAIVSSFLPLLTTYVHSCILIIDNIYDLFREKVARKKCFSF